MWIYAAVVHRRYTVAAGVAVVSKDVHFLDVLGRIVLGSRT
jgi:hypothetical protein